MTPADPGPQPLLLWTPSSERDARANLHGFARASGVPSGDYEELWRWSVDDVERFWGAVWEYFDVAGARGDAVLGSRSMPGAEWFPGATLSYAEHLGRGRPDDAVAIRHASEVRPYGEVTWGELRAQAGAIAGGLRRMGVGRGDRVAAYMPNIPETIAAFWACASIGAIWSSAAPEFGAAGVVDRFAQIEPKVLLAVDGYRYGGKEFDRRGTAAEIGAAIGAPVVTFGYLDGTGWDDGFACTGDELRFERVPFDHPLWVLYSSGTTGLPKAIVHGHGGMLLEHLKVIHLQLDAHPEDRVFWFTTTGWMMWNFLVAVLLSEASIVLFDGNPGYPDLGRLWDLAEESGTTTFGTSAAFIASCMKAGVEPAGGRDLSELAAVGSTGSPLSPDGFRWVYDKLGSDTWLFSTSGGTDMCTAFVGGVPTKPVYLGRLQGRALGAGVQAWDDDGNAVTGAVGELVLAQPMPCMPVGFWNDDDGSRYREAYFDHYPGVWRHGDWVEIGDDGSAVIHGRSDSTINRGGVRMGTSELYRSVLREPEVVDALVVDVPRDGDENWMPLFVVLDDGAELTDDLVGRLRGRIRRECSPRHVPDVVINAPGVPRTLSGKVLEVPVKRILMGAAPEAVASRQSLANPSALDWFAVQHSWKSNRHAVQSTT